MRLDHDETHYDVLEVSPSCNASELREAYQRIKHTFSRDNNALYTMMDTSEREALLERIEKAYSVLGDHQSRRAYDLAHGFIDGAPPTTVLTHSEAGPFAAHLETLLALPTDTGIVSIDRVPPMDPTAGDESLLIPPATDSAAIPQAARTEEPIPVAPPPQPAAAAASSPTNVPRPPNAPPSPLRTQIDPALRARMDTEQGWPGDLLRQIRESQHISIEELAELTKVSKTNLLALEAENFDKLPAAVFVRGFLTQACRAIKLPADKIDSAVLAYLKRYRDHVQKKTGQSD